MEVVGVVASAITLAALFKTCVDAFDTIQLYQNQDADFKKLLLRLNVEKCRLYVWGRSMRLGNGSAASSLDGCPFADVVSECLDQIVQIFNDSERIRDKYGCAEFSSSSEMQVAGQRQGKNVKIFAAAFGNFRTRTAQDRKKKGAPVTPLTKTLWVIQDRKKFLLLIEEVKSLVDGLQDITKDLSSTAKQDETISSRIMGIRDIGTLEMVADVCETTHPQIAYAASTRADSISMATSRRHKIVAWRDQIESEESDGTSVAHLENLTVTELKYQVSRLLRDRLERERNVPSGIAVPASTQPDHTDGAAADDGAKEPAPPTIASLQEMVNGLEKERDFYFSKLRDIELLVHAEIEQDPKLDLAPDSWTKSVQAILYAIEEGFEIPSDAEDQSSKEDDSSTENASTKENEPNKEGESDWEDEASPAESS